MPAGRQKRREVRAICAHGRASWLLLGRGPRSVRDVAGSRRHRERMRLYMERKASADWTPPPLQVARKRAGLSRGQLANRARISERTIDRIEQREVRDV